MKFIEILHMYQPDSVCILNKMDLSNDILNCFTERVFCFFVEVKHHTNLFNGNSLTYDNILWHDLYITSTQSPICFTVSKWFLVRCLTHLNINPLFCC